MKLAIPKETFEGERRVPMIPVHVEKLVKKGAGSDDRIRYG